MKFWEYLIFPILFLAALSVIIYFTGCSSQREVIQPKPLCPFTVTNSTLTERAREAVLRRLVMDYPSTLFNKSIEQSVLLSPDRELFWVKVRISQENGDYIFRYYEVDCPNNNKINCVAWPIS